MDPSFESMVLIQPQTGHIFDCAVMKFGIQKLLDIEQEHIPLADEVCAVCGLYPATVAASNKETIVGRLFFATSSSFSRQ